MRARADIALVAGGVALAVAALTGCGENLTPPAGADAGGATFDCLPNLDGRITADELPVSLGVTADYFVSTGGATVNLAGTVDEAGRRVWDFSSESAADERRALGPVPLADQWYAGDVPGGELVVPALSADSVDGVYSRDDRGLWLHALASPSPEPASQRTLLVYDAPVLVVRLPIAPGDGFTSTGAVTGGTLKGLPYNGTDTYQVEVDATGRLEVPALTFTQVHRVRTRVESTTADVTVTRRQVSFFFECFGEVTRAVSNDNEADPDFTSAAELRRFAL